MKNLCDAPLMVHVRHPLGVGEGGNLPDGLRADPFIPKEEKKMATVYLSRRNLLVLLSKLDRNLKAPGISACTIVKRDTVHQKYPCSEVTNVIAVENGEYYDDRRAGQMHPEDEDKIRA